MLDTLENLNEDDPLLAGHVDLAHTGMFGHSFGGAVAAELARDDSRVDAALNMDGTMFGPVGRSGLSKPFLMMKAEPAVPTDAELTAIGMTREDYDRSNAAYTRSIDTVLKSARPGYLIEVKGSRHNTFTTDFLTFAGRYADVVGPDMIGTIDREAALSLIRADVTAFFDQTLKGQAGALQAAASGSAAPVQTFNTDAAS